MNDTKQRVIIGTIMVIMVMIIFGLAYATVTHKLLIVRDTQNRNIFKISFENLSPVELTGTAKEITRPTINTYETRISNYSVSLTSPGDRIVYRFDVHNKGDYNALISAIHIPIPVCYGSGKTALRDAKGVCSNLKYTLNYESGKPVKIGDTLFSKERKRMVLTLDYSKYASSYSLARNYVSIDNLDVDIYYSQCDKRCNVAR